MEQRGQLAARSLLSAETSWLPLPFQKRRQNKLLGTLLKMGQALGVHQLSS
jgi:hypothetical protein